MADPLMADPDPETHPDNRPAAQASRTHPSSLRRISWGAIFAGAVVAIVVGLSLNLLGLGVGLSAFSPASDGDSARGLGTGQAIWFVISSLIALFAGGWVAGHLAGIPRRVDGVLHGLVAWGLTTLLTVYLVSSGVGALLGGVTNLVGAGLGAAGAGIAAVAPQAGAAAGRELDRRGITLDRIQAEAEALLRDTGNPALQPGNLEAQARAAGQDAQAGATQAARTPSDADLRAAIDRVVGRGQGVADQASRDDLVNILVARTDMNEAEARQTVAQWEEQGRAARAQLDTLGQRSVQATEDATDAVGRAALWGFFGLLLGALAAGFGGGLGARHVFAEPYPEGYDTPVVRRYDAR